MSGGMLTNCEAASGQQFVQQRRVGEIGWSDGKVGVIFLEDPIRAP